MTLEITAITFFIIDTEWEDEYEYTAYFFTEDEVGGFITDNEAVGNSVRMLKVEIFEGEEAMKLIRSYGYLEEAASHLGLL